MEYFAGFADWSRQRTLVFDVINASSETYPLSMRIDDDENCDTYERRFNHRFEIAPGLNEITVPIDAIRKGPRTREMHMGKIKRVLFFNPGDERPFVLYLDNMRLE